MAETVSPFHPSSAESGNGSGPRSVVAPSDSRSSPSLATTVRLIRPITEAVWLADADGSLVTARPVSGSGGPGAAGLWTNNASLDWATGAHPHVLSPRGTATVDGSTWLISDYLSGVRLGRLLTAAILTPWQAAYVGIDLLSGLAELHGAGLLHGRLTAQSAVVGADGTLRLTDLAAAVPADADRQEALRAADLRQARALLGDLARNADRPSARRRPDETRLLTGLVTLGASSEWSSATAGLSRLMALALDCGGADWAETDVRRQLAALAAAADRVDARTPARPDATESVDARSGSSPDLPSRSLSDANWRPRRRRWPWLVAAVVVAALAATAVVERGPLMSFVDRVLHRSAAQSTSSSKITTPRTVPRFAPAAAGPIRAVTVHRLRSCRPGHSCRLHIAIRVRPSAHRRSVHWTAQVVHRCSTAASERRGSGVVHVRPHARMATDTHRITLPSGHAMAVVIVTTRPAHAAARPLLIPRAPSRC